MWGRLNVVDGSKLTIIPVPFGESDFSFNDLKIDEAVYKFNWSFNIVDNFWYLEILNVTEGVLEVASTKMIKDKKVEFRKSFLTLNIKLGTTIYKRDTFSSIVYITNKKEVSAPPWTRAL
jgi:hypothetical protein